MVGEYNPEGEEKGVDQTNPCDSWEYEEAKENYSSLKKRRGKGTQGVFR